MKVYFTGAGPGNPDYLTVKALRLLERAECCIWAGSLVNPALLEILPAACRIFDSAGMSLAETVAVMQEYAGKDIDVIRLHTGDPSLYGAINEQMRQLDQLGIAYELVPGIGAFQAAAASLCCELTAPEISQSVVLTRTSGRTPLPAGQELANFAATGATLCIYLSAHKPLEVCETLIPYYGSDCPAAFIYHASWPDEDRISSTLAELPELVANSGYNRTSIILVGRALARVGAESKLYAADFTHGYRRGRENLDC